MNNMLLRQRNHVHSHRQERNFHLQESPLPCRLPVKIVLYFPKFYRISRYFMLQTSTFKAQTPTFRKTHCVHHYDGLRWKIMILYSDYQTQLIHSRVKLARTYYIEKDNSLVAGKFPCRRKILGYCLKKTVYLFDSHNHLKI